MEEFIVTDAQTQKIVQGYSVWHGFRITEEAKAFFLFLGSCWPMGREGRDLRRSNGTKDDCGVDIVTPRFTIFINVLLFQAGIPRKKKTTRKRSLDFSHGQFQVAQRTKTTSSQKVSTRKRRV